MPFDNVQGNAAGLRGGFRLETVRGTVRTLGQASMHMEGHVYAFIKFDLANGGELMVERVGVLNSVGSELEPGVSGTFHLLRNKQACGLVAFAGDNGRSGDDVVAFLKGMRTIKGLRTLFAAALTYILWIFLGLFILAELRGVQLGYFMFYLYWAAPGIFFIHRFRKSIPTASEVWAAIAGSRS